MIKLLSATIAILSFVFIAALLISYRLMVLIIDMEIAS